MAIADAHSRHRWGARRRSCQSETAGCSIEERGIEMVNKAPKFYPGEDPIPKNPPQIQKKAKLRPSITPGTLLILLAGRFRGRKVVFLKQLDSGLLLVTGPFGVNGVPLRRVNQAYVIASSTKIDVSGVDCTKFDDKYFAKGKKSRSKKSEEEFFDPAKKPELPAHKVEDQKAMDAALVKKIEAEPMLSEYMKSVFTLRSGDYPHKMKF